MQAEIGKRLVEINRQFYEDFGKAFAITRSRIQPGVKRIFEMLPVEDSTLDLGCGNGALALEWVNQKRRGFYLGIDFSPVLLDEARHAIEGKESHGLQVKFCQADLANPTWFERVTECVDSPIHMKKSSSDEDFTGFATPCFNTVLMFASIHHLPGHDLRLDLLKRIRDFLSPGSRLILSVWQFQHSAKWNERRQPWDLVGLRPEDVDAGDTLLDWRFQLPGKKERVGLRYVHLFSHEELAELAASSGFELVEEFVSDGEGGNLSLYQVWQASS